MATASKSHGDRSADPCSFFTRGSRVWFARPACFLCPWADADRDRSDRLIRTPSSERIEHSERVDGALCSWAPAADEPTIDGQPQLHLWKGEVAEVKPLQVAPPPVCDNMCNRSIATALDRHRAPTETPERADDGR